MKSFIRSQNSCISVQSFHEPEQVLWGENCSKIWFNKISTLTFESWNFSTHETHSNYVKLLIKECAGLWTKTKSKSSSCCVEAENIETWPKFQSLPSLAYNRFRLRLIELSFDLIKILKAFHFQDDTDKSKKQWNLSFKFEKELKINF